MKRGRPRAFDLPAVPRLATDSQLDAHIACKPGDVINVRLRTGNVQRFIVCELPAEFGSGAGQVHAKKMGAGKESPIRRISPEELVI